MHSYSLLDIVVALRCLQGQTPLHKAVIFGHVSCVQYLTRKAPHTVKYKDTVEQLYRRMDDLIGKVRRKLDDDTVLIVMSDHGFTNFRRGVNLNAWLRDEGYLFLKDGAETSPDWLAKVDWSRTKAFTLGLTGLFINRKGREAHGIVEKGAELDALCAELKGKLEALRDPLDGQPVVKECFLTREMHDGPYADMAPELLIGYHKGYRHSWDCATGSVSTEVFSRPRSSVFGTRPLVTSRASASTLRLPACVS